MTTYYVPSTKWIQWLDEPTGVAVFQPNEAGRLERRQPGRPAPAVEALSQARPGQSPKGLLFPSLESVGRYGTEVSAATALQAEPAVLIGLRACELRAMRFLDKVLLDGSFQDAAYAARREATTVVSLDCADCRETCFCTLVGGQPFATEGYDVNLTPVDGGVIVDVATERGAAWVARAGQDVPAEAAAEQLARRDRQRQRMTERVQSQNAAFTFTADDGTRPALPDDDDPSWQRFAADCVECAACTNVCPTCHCFYLYDQSLGPERFERVRTWDSCLLSSYHRMAGTPAMKPTPRPRLRSRLANRVLHKFSYSPEQYGLLGCVGCGRCVEGCLGGIDIRQAVQELSQ